MDRVDKDNGEESRNEEWRREGQNDTHTQMRCGILRGGRFCGHIAHLVLGGREKERERAEGDTGVRGSGEEEGEAVDVKTTTPEERQHSEVLVERIG